MSFPVDKETWRRVIGKNLSIGQVGDNVTTDDHNLIADFLERLEDILGINFIEGYTDLKAKLQYILDQVALAGDFKADGSVPMTGDLDMNYKEIVRCGKLEIASPFEQVYMYIQQTESQPSGKAWLLIEGNYGNVDFLIECDCSTQETKLGSVNDHSVNLIVNSVPYIKLDKSDDTIKFLKEILINGSYDMTFDTSLKGVIVKTPDGTKSYRLGVDNSGNVISTLIV